ncbi:MAG: hypothetical protein KatS3mg001_102 [Candidatus Pacearchaeota archaeon]|nr:MAG: hypothetical protein KatS3mg001_102 [Candidatus Pacearchaeota archaeon]
MEFNKVKIAKGNIYIPKGTLLYHMVKCSYIRVLEVFFREPTTIHFIKEISKKIKLAHPSVRNYIRELTKKGLIIKRKSKPFDGYVANRENDSFIWLKMSYNILSLKELRDKIINELHPKAIILFGSYLRGEDVESSDIDFFVVSKIKKEIDFSKFESVLKRRIRVIILDDFSKLDKNIQKKIKNGLVLYGGL